MCIKHGMLWHNEHSSTNAFREPGFTNGTEAHIWYVNTEALSESIVRYYGVLSDEEKAQAERFPQLKNQHSYVVSQGIKRLILSAYVDCHPVELRFEHNRYGKPFLSTSKAKIAFNVSHSKNVILIAVTKGTEIGIDVEYMNSEFDWRAIADKFFSVDELQHLVSCTGDETTPLFFSYWTQKEAILKARGVGLFGIKEANFESGSWTAVDYTNVPFQLNDRYQGSLAVSQIIHSVRFYAYTKVPTPPHLVVKGNQFQFTTNT